MCFKYIAATMFRIFLNAYAPLRNLLKGTVAPVKMGLKVV
jgi:hypothetical protein